MGTQGPYSHMARISCCWVHCSLRQVCIPEGGGRGRASPALFCHTLPTSLASLLPVLKFSIPELVLLSPSYWTWVHSLLVTEVTCKGQAVSGDVGRDLSEDPYLSSLLTLQLSPACLVQSQVRTLPSAYPWLQTLPWALFTQPSTVGADHPEGRPVVDLRAELGQLKPPLLSLGCISHPLFS